MLKNKVMNNRNVNYANLFEDMVDFTYDYVVSNELQSAVLGVSGGIDSTVVAALLYEVKKRLEISHPDMPFGVLGYSLPTQTTADDEYLISTFVGNAFCSTFTTYNIGEVATKVYDSFVGAGCFWDAFRSGNIKARLRMIYLYDKAKAYNGFVVGTDNFTERLLGFSTIGGDALADYMPIQYLWKTDVYKLAEYLLNKYKAEDNYAAVNAIYQSMNIPPQDGLGISTSDMDQIGANSYYDVDEILYAYVKAVGVDVRNTNSDAHFEFMNGKYNELTNKFTKYVVDAVLYRYLNNFKLALPIEFFGVAPV